MQLTRFDWYVVVLVVGVSFLPTLLLAKRAGRSTTEFFASGRSAPWWLIGISMVATTFSTDTPNLVTNFVRLHGVSYNWVWWAFLLTGIMTVFFYSSLWRRSKVLTDLEFYEIRYSGRPASVVRGFRAIYLGLFFNCVIMAVVNLAAVKIANVLLGWPPIKTIVICALINIPFAAAAGLWGVMVADMIQFMIAMGGSVVVAYYALQHPLVGGLSGLISKIDPKTLNMLPDFGDWGLTLSVLIIPLTVQWWSVWYPGSEPGGGSYIAQRMLAARTEKDALGGTLFFSFCHYALRPWPWILVALSSMLVFPHLSDLQKAFPNLDPKLLGDDLAYPAMVTFVPAGLLGLVVAGLTSAYISTICTHLNWGTSYLVHDFYKRFVRVAATETHYILVSRIVTALLMVAAAGLTFVIETAQHGFELLLSIGAGTGLIYLLRWFWWRINAWSEIAAMASSFIVAFGFFIAGRMNMNIPSHIALLTTVACTTVVWLVVTLLTRPVDRETLLRFYKLVLPAGPGWKNIRAQAGACASPDNLTLALLCWVLGCLFVYATLFGIGSFIYGNIPQGLMWLVVFLISLVWLVRLLPRIWRR